MITETEPQKQILKHRRPSFLKGCGTFWHRPLNPHPTGALLQM